MVAYPASLLDHIYEAAVIPEVWPRVLEGLCDISGSWGAALMTVNDGIARYTTTETYSRGFKTFVERGNPDLNVRPKRALAMRHQGFLRDTDLCSMEELAVDPIYDQFLRPYGLGWTVGTVIAVPSGDLLVFDIARKNDLGPFAPDVPTRLDHYRPHLARSALLASRLGLAQAQSAAAVLQSVGLPAAVISSAGRVVACNGLLEAMAPHVSIGARDRLTVSDPGAQRLLQAEFSKVHRGEGASVRSIPVPGTDGALPFIVHLTPVRRAAHDVFGLAHTVAVVTSVSMGGVPNADLLQGLFDLTATEARVARSLLEGASAAEIARTNGVSINTVRSQIRLILTKTGVSRQVDLVALLVGSPLHSR